MRSCLAWSAFALGVLCACGQDLVLGRGSDGLGGNAGAGPQPAASGAANCPAGCSCDHSYAYCPPAYSRSAAADHCASVGRALVKIETATEQEYIAKAARESGVVSYWIGLSSLVDPALFAWEDGTPVFEYPTRTGCVTDLTFKQRCYESFVEWGDFQTNRSRCHGLGTGWELAALRTLQEEQFVRSFIQDSELFLAGSDATEEGRWRWLTADILFWVGLADGAAQVAPHTNGTEHAGWEPGQPNNDLNAESGMDADCLVIHPLGWSDVPCGDAVFGALCEQAGSTIDGQYAHFGADQPNDGDASCVLVPEGANTWWDASCELQLGFVCE